VTIDSLPGNSFVVAGQFNGWSTRIPTSWCPATAQADSRYLGDGAAGSAPRRPCSARRAPASDCFTGVRVADVNGDSRDDLVAAVREDDGSTTVTSWLGAGLGTFTTVTTTFTAAQNVYLADLCVGDFAGSSSPD